MEADFWRRKWRDDQLGWHQPAAHPMLVRHVGALGLAEGARVFVPLCGKSLDVHWLLRQGYRVAGAELVETAVAQLFAELGLEPEIHDVGLLKRYRADGIDVFAGDLFALEGEVLGAVDAVYDRAALVALPPETRPAYAAHVAALASRAPQLLITFDYDQSRMEGPPFSVPAEEVRALYAPAYRAAPLETAEVAGGLKGVCPALETAWSLVPAA